MIGRCTDRAEARRERALPRLRVFERRARGEPRSIHPNTPAQSGNEEEKMGRQENRLLEIESRRVAEADLAVRSQAVGEEEAL
jgi:hypothetical protein